VGRRPRRVGLIGPGLFLIGWWLLSVVYRHPAPPVMPSPQSVAATFGRAWQQGLGGDIAASAEDAAGGWVVGCAGALLVGGAIGRVRWLSMTIGPVIEVLRPVSALAWVPLAIVWFGIGYSSKLFVVALATFFVAVVHMAQGAEAATASHLKVARMLTMRRRDAYRYVILPSAVPDIMLALRQGLGVAWGGVILPNWSQAIMGRRYGDSGPARL
jgi:ABC-type nitrate/sulfonate/bicarbonate transport system permease component